MFPETKENEFEARMKKYEGLRVLCVESHPLFTEGVSAVHMLKMCQAMANLGIEVECVLPGRVNKKRLFSYYGIKNPFRVTSIALSGGLARRPLHGFLSALYACGKKENFDLVLTRDLIFAWFATKVFEVPTVYDAHHPPVNWAAETIISSFSRSKNLLGMSFNSRGLHDIYFCLGMTGQNPIVAPNGFEREAFEGEHDIPSLRERLGLPLERKIVCYCGNTYRGRGIEILVRAAAQMPEVEFLIVGGRERDNVLWREMARQQGSGNFRIEGFVQQREVPSYLLASDVLVMPYSSKITIRDGTEAGRFTSPLKLFEYMAAGKPIVATGVPSVLEILRPGENSVVTPPDDSGEFIRVLGLVLADSKLCTRVSERARSDAVGYTWEKRVEKIIDGVGVAVE